MVIVVKIESVVGFTGMVYAALLLRPQTRQSNNASGIHLNKDAQWILTSLNNIVFLGYHSKTN